MRKFFEKYLFLGLMLCLCGASFSTSIPKLGTKPHQSVYPWVRINIKIKNSTTFRIKGSWDTKFTLNPGESLDYFGGQYMSPTANLSIGLPTFRISMIDTFNISRLSDYDFLSFLNLNLRIVNNRIEAYNITTEFFDNNNPFLRNFSITFLNPAPARNRYPLADELDIQIEIRQISSCTDRIICPDCFFGFGSFNSSKI